LLARPKSFFEERPVCQVCGNRVTYNGRSDKLFHSYCCTSCASKATADQAKAKKLEKYGDYTHKAKRDQTNLERYGSTCNWGNKENHAKCVKTTKEKYILDDGTNLIVEKYKRTCLEKYGYENVNQVPEIHQKIVDTCQEKYGNHSYLGSNDFYTKKYKRGKFDSKFEEKLYNWLLEVFDSSDILLHYSSELYPFKTDFYIKSIDLYIEAQIYYTHGTHPFDSNNFNDLQRLETLKKKYNPEAQIITIWTIIDPEKRQIALSNNLNYLEIFDYFIKKEEFVQILKDYQNGVIKKYKVFIHDK
jgi:hypothetical protein